MRQYNIWCVRVRSVCERYAGLSPAYLSTHTKRYAASSHIDFLHF